MRNYDSHGVSIKDKSETITRKVGKGILLTTSSIALIYGLYEGAKPTDDEALPTTTVVCDEILVNEHVSLEEIEDRLPASLEGTGFEGDISWIFLERNSTLQDDESRNIGSLPRSCTVSTEDMTIQERHDFASDNEDVIVHGAMGDSNGLESQHIIIVDKEEQ